MAARCVVRVLLLLLAPLSVFAAAPAIDSFAPASAQAATVVSITGTDLSDAEAVAFNGVPATFRVGADDIIHATVPVGASTGPITVGNSTGTASSATDFQVLASPAVLVGAGDISDCVGKAEDTAKLIDGIAGTVITVGDHAYNDGTAAEFNACYEPTWGRHKSRTRPAAGSVEYDTPGASAYFNYFGPAAGEPGKGYYSYDVGDWHIVALNSQCDEVGGCTADSPQGRWLREDLLTHAKTCQLAYWAAPRFSSGPHGSNAAYGDFWQILHAAGAEIVVSGHDHVYERFAPQTPAGVADPLGVRQFVVGTGGRGLYSVSVAQPNSEIYNTSTHGVLRLTLNPASYDWRFIPIAGKTFTDSGSAACHQVNQVPIVEAGPDQVVLQNDGAMLNGRALDDRLPDPPGTFITTWSQVSGPGTASFADLTAADTTATFSEGGTYVLRLTGDDGEHVVTDDVEIVVIATGAEIRDVEARVTIGADDAEENKATGTVSLSSSDLELTADGSIDQLVGLRFANVAIPDEATIVSAHVQFQVDEVSVDPANLTIWGEAADQSPTFVSATGNVSARSRTSSSASWIPPAWPTIDVAGVDHRTPDLWPIIREIVDRPGWISGHALTLIMGGVGRRTAEAYEGGAAPILRIRYAMPLPEPESADLAVTLSDSPDPVLLGQSVTYTTTVTNSGPATATGVTASGTLESCNIGTLLPNTSSTCTAQVVAGSMTLPTQSMTVSANEPDTVLSNNSASASTTVRAPDLVVAQLTAEPSGGKLLINSRVTNAGNGAAGAFVVRFYLSVDDIFDAGDISLCSRSVSSLAAGASSPSTGTRQTSCTIPAVAGGNYFVIAAADAGAVIPESNEANNVAVSAAVSISGPDLVPTAVTAARVAGHLTKVTVGDTIRNQGNAAISNTTITIRYFISTDATYEAGTDLALATRANGTSPCARTLSSLSGGAISSGTKTCYKPAGAQDGVPYYVLVFDDSANVVVESDEINNVLATAGTIQW